MPHGSKNHLIPPHAMAALLILLFSCATTYLTPWTDPYYAGIRLNKIAVFGLFKKISDRSIFERTLVHEFNKQGIEAVASIDLMPLDKIFKNREKNIDLITHNANADGILILRLLSIEKEKQYVPGDVHYYYNYYWHYWDLLQSPVEVITSTKVSLDMRVYANSTDQLVWAAESETYDPDSMQEAAASVAKKVIRSLREKKLIQ